MKYWHTVTAICFIVAGVNTDISAESFFDRSRASGQTNKALNSKQKSSATKSEHSKSKPQFKAIPLFNNRSSAIPLPKNTGAFPGFIERQETLKTAKQLMKTAPETINMPPLVMTGLGKQTPEAPT